MLTFFEYLFDSFVRSFQNDCISKLRPGMGETKLKTNTLLYMSLVGVWDNEETNN